MRNKNQKFKLRGISRILFLFMGLILLAVQAMAQQTATGQVTAINGEPIPGATIVLKGTSTGTVTDSDGNFTLPVRQGDILVISFVGMKSQEVPFSGQSRIEIELEQDVIGLEEVVAVGYGTMRKSDLTGANASANIEAFRESPNVNVLQSLQGSVAGVNIAQVNRAGQEPSIEIRGRTTLSGSRSPLIVLDGIIYRGNISDINPGDIQSVDVLKDASSKAIYGAQAANGVLLITTKQGKVSRKPTISYSGSVSSSVPTVNSRLRNREEVLQRVKDINYKDAYLAPDYTQPNPEWDYDQSELLPNLLDGVQNGTDYDWWGNLTSPGYIHNHMINVSGGTDKTSYYISGGYTDQKGFVINDKYDRTSIRINFDTEVTDWLTVGANTYGSFTDYSGSAPSFRSLTHMSPLLAPKNEAGEYIIYPAGNNDTNPFLTPSAEDSDLRNNLSGIFYGIIKIPWVKGLNYRLNYSNNLRHNEHFNSNQYGASVTGVAYKNYASNKDMMLDNILTYENQFGKHDVKATLVAGYNKVQFNNTSARAENIPNFDLGYNSLEQGIIQTVRSGAWEESSIYQMGRLSYKYDNRYLLTATLRRDGYSGFAKNNKFGYFPSAGIGWVLTEESFFNLRQIDYLKIRASYGQNGNQTSRYSSLARINASNDLRYVFGDGASSTIGQSVASLANNDLSWEKTTGLNIGLDFSIFDNRLGGNIEYYTSTTTDLLWNMRLPRTTGFGSISTNLGEIENKGFEFVLEGTPIAIYDFSWDISIQFSTNKNKVISLLGEDIDGDGVEDDLIASGLFIGESIGTIYNYEVDGLWQLDEEIPDGYAAGTYRIVDQQPEEEYEISADNDRVILGRSEPAYRFGIQNTLAYRNFSLRFFLNSIQGGKNGYLHANYPTGVGTTPGSAQNSNTFTHYDYWSPNNPGAEYPITWVSVQKSPPKYYQRNFVRLQDISFAYNLNKKVADKLGLDNLKIYVSGKNVLTFTKWDGWDPETGLGIGNSSVYPVMKSYTLGLDVTF